ncbi:hypothetical protein TNCV_4825571 [Trichonephila clavipes]|uniref:Uncharacterized protein n=1 Tax=Trichonephila clavipes TaxID=2585209 RepID=A0A8X6RMP9_TRICX|nr:hypothetical protein TNCV_4825571 [Trichonephila clavipes]
MITQTSSNSVAQQPMRARAYCAHPSIRDHWALRCMSRCLDQVVSLKRDPQCLSPQFTCRNCGGGDRGRVAIYRPFGEFRRAKSYCHLYGAQGQRQAYLLPMPR